MKTINYNVYGENVFTKGIERSSKSKVLCTLLGHSLLSVCMSKVLLLKAVYKFTLGIEAISNQFKPTKINLINFILQH